jgi:hypothetical protein
MGALDYNLYYNTDGNVTFRYGPDDGLVSYTFAQWKTFSGGDVHSISGIDPLLTDINNLDFTLQSTSPAINAGVDVSLASDYAGTPIFGLPEIGAFEIFEAIVSLTTVNPTISARITGNEDAYVFGGTVTHTRNRQRTRSGRTN